MNNMFIMFIFLISLIIILILINLLVNKKMLNNREKKTPFECGFNPMTNARLPMSIQFFIISLIFLIFDVEIALLFPLIFLMNYLYKFMIFSFWLLIMILFISLYIEWMEKSLNWINLEFS